MVEVLLWVFGGEPLYNPEDSFEEITQDKRKKPSKNSEEFDSIHESFNSNALSFET